jgi:hypothetical protein
MTEMWHTKNLNTFCYVFCPRGKLLFLMKKYLIEGLLIFSCTLRGLLHPVLVRRGGIMTNCPPRPEHKNKFIENSARSKNMLQNVQYSLKEGLRRHVAG